MNRSPSPPEQCLSAGQQDTSFISSGMSCAAWLFSTPGRSASTCIVMAHGFGGTRHYGLSSFAQRFHDAGYNVLLFDYRHFGESEGEPRGLIRVKKQIADWHAAIAHARALGYHQIVLWGTSFAGGHVLRAAAEDQNVSGVISQVPHTDGLATTLAVPAKYLGGLIKAMICDAVLSLFGKRHFIPAFGRPGELAAMSTPGAHQSLVRMLPAAHEGTPSTAWRAYFDNRNKVTALSLLETQFYSPGKQAQKIKCPVLLQAATKDQTTPFKAARKTATRIPDCDFRVHEADHFDVYLEPHFSAVIHEQIEFLQRRVGPNPCTKANDVKET